MRIVSGGSNLLKHDYAKWYYPIVKDMTLRDEGDSALDSG